MRACGAVAAAAIALAGCGGDAPARLTLRLPRVGRHACPVTAPLGRTRAPRRLATLAGPAAAADSFGKGGLWVLLPLHTGAEPVHAGYTFKVPWYLDGRGGLRVVGERLDGAGRVDYDAYAVPGPGPRMQASSLTVSALGCYGIRAAHGGQVITWVFRARITPPAAGDDRPAARAQ